MLNIAVEAGADDDDLGSIRLEDETWALAIWATRPDLWKLADIEETDWDQRRTLKVGTCANAQAWWSERDGTVSILVGDDDEAYDFWVTVPLSAVHEILAQLERQELPPLSGALLVFLALAKALPMPAAIFWSRSRVACR
jgi:hypothetical protein